MNKILIVIDMQRDFVYGTLGTPEARAIVPKIKKKINGYRRHNDDVIFTLDTHFDDYLNTHEGKRLKCPHCLIGTEGRQPVYEINDEDDIIAPKFSFGVTNWHTVLPSDVCTTKPETTIEIVGVCTDICVITNALMLRAQFPELDIVVDASCCAGTTPEKHRMALKIMKGCHIDIINE